MQRDDQFAVPDRSGGCTTLIASKQIEGGDRK
jgi:hypothetical protein